MKTTFTNFLETFLVGITYLLVIAVLSFVPTIESFAQSSLSGININSDSMFRDSTKNQIILEGNVKVSFQGQNLTCDKATIFLEKKVILAEGNVILKNDRVHSEGSRMEFNYETNTGILYDGFVKSGQVVFEGDVVEKVDDQKYIAINGRYTACDTCPPAWSFSGNRIEAEIGGYAFINYPILRIGGIPVLILPPLPVPLKSDRQSGVLPPSLEIFNKTDFALALPYFWAISQDKDFTLTAKNYSRRGLKGLGEFRYALTENSGGELSGAFLRDQGFKQNPDDDTEMETTLDRWFLKYDHYYELPENIVHRANLAIASDLRYPRDYGAELPGHSDPALENKVSVSKNSHGTHISGETSYYINLLKEDALADDVNSVHRFPDIKFHLLQTPVAKTPLMFKLDANFTQFSRENFGYDDVALVGETINSDGDLCENEKCIRENRDGHFDPSKDIIRTGYRFDVAPTLSLPFHLGQFNLVPEIKYRETQYRFNSEKNCSNLTGADLISCEAAIYSPTAERRYLDMTLSAKTVFSKVYGGSNPKGTKYRHEIEPEVTYSTIPWIRRPEHSFFGQFEGQPYSQESEPLSDDDFFGTNKVQFDYNDRVFDRRIVNFALSNKIIRKETIGNLDKYKQIFLFRLSQSFDFNETDTDNPQPWSTINGLLDVRLDHFETYATAIYYPYAQVTNWAGRVKLLDSFGNFVQLRYNRQVLVNENNEIDFENKTSDVSLDTGFVSKFFNLTGFVTYSTVVSEIKQWGYYLQIKPPGNCWNIQLGQTQRLKAPGTLTANISFEFGGGPLK